MLDWVINLFKTPVVLDKQDREIANRLGMNDDYIRKHLARDEASKWAETKVTEFGLQVAGQRGYLPISDCKTFTQLQQRMDNEVQASDKSFFLTQVSLEDWWLSFPNITEGLGNIDEIATFYSSLPDDMLQMDAVRFATDIARIKDVIATRKAKAELKVKSKEYINAIIKEKSK